MTGEAVQLQPEKQCEEKVRLMSEYTTATSEFSRTLNTLYRDMGVLRKAEYDRIRGFIEKARTRSETARIALERHILQHGC